VGGIAVDRGDLGDLSAEVVEVRAGSHLCGRDARAGRQARGQEQCTGGGGEEPAGQEHGDIQSGDGERGRSSLTTPPRSPSGSTGENNPSPAHAGARAQRNRWMIRYMIAASRAAAGMVSTQAT